MNLSSTIWRKALAECGRGVDRLRGAVVATRLLVVVCGALATANAMFAQPTSSGVRAVVQVSTVTARTSEGKVATFSDTAGRVFAVAYDEAGRVSTVLATRGRHFSDVLSIGYSTNGAVIGVMLGNGERLFFDYPRDGMQVIRTGKGGEIRRDAGRVIGSTADPDSDRLRSTVERLDALFFALGR